MKASGIGGKFRHVTSSSHSVDYGKILLKWSPGRLPKPYKVISFD